MSSGLCHLYRTSIRDAEPSKERRALLLNCEYGLTFLGGLRPAISMNGIYVALTTLGYGDISPVAGFLVYMEAIVGVFYMAVLVASLIGIRLADIQAGNK